METETTYQVLISLLTGAVIMAASWCAYDQGYMDPLIEKASVFLMKAKAEAEAKRMQAQGLTRGEDFVDLQLRGNEQADEIKAGVGSLGGLKKGL